MRTAKILIRLGGCPGWSESLLGAHAILLVLSFAGSILIWNTEKGKILRFNAFFRHILSYMSQGRKQHMARPGLEPRPLAYRARTLANWATEPHCRPATISPCLNRFVPESARSRAGTDETVPLLLTARARTHTGHQISQGRKKHMARPGLEPRTSRIPYRATRSTCDIYMKGYFQWLQPSNLRKSERPKQTCHFRWLARNFFRYVTNPTQGVLNHSCPMLVIWKPALSSTSTKQRSCVIIMLVINLFKVLLKYM